MQRTLQSIVLCLGLYMLDILTYIHALSLRLLTPRALRDMQVGRQYYNYIHSVYDSYFSQGWNLLERSGLGMFGEKCTLHRERGNFKNTDVNILEEKLGAKTCKPGYNLGLKMDLRKRQPTERKILAHFRDHSQSNSFQRYKDQSKIVR